MKSSRFIFSVLVITSTFIFFSCTDLKEQYLDSVASTDATFSPPSSSSLEAIVVELRTAFSGQENWYALGTHSTDELMGPTRGSDWSDFGVWRTLHQHNFDPANKQITDTWNTLHKAVVSCNTAIRGLQGNSTALAQATAYRSFVLFLLADLWGQVPFREPSVTDFLAPPSVLSRSEAISKAIADLEGVISDLPDKDGTGYTYGFPTKDVGYAILTKLYLNKFVMEESASAPALDMDKVISNADKIINSGNYSLATDYFVQNFGKDNHDSPEGIFAIEITPSQPGNIRSRWKMTLHYYHEGTTSGWNGFTTLASFYNKFDQTDVRFKDNTTPIKGLYGLDAGFLQGQQKSKDGSDLKNRVGGALAYTPDVDLFFADEVQGVRVIKYLPENENNDNPSNDIQVIRYADVLLMKAEALWRKGSEADALVLLNQVRSARGLGNMTTISANGSTILDERGFELYWEGWRRNDQIRFGTWGNEWEFKALSTSKDKELFPIPLNALAANPALKQNPGY